LLAALVLPTSVAQAGPYAQVLHVYQTTGTIPPCEFSSSQLATALKGVDTYGAQYFSDFTDAIQSALTTRGSGGCSHGGVPASSGAAGALRAPGVRSLTAPTAADLPAPMLLMVGLALAFALIGTVAAVGRARGWSPAWALRWRHAWGEAGYRVSGTWAEFVDWLRSER
jgi:hypothetical protein